MSQCSQYAGGMEEVMIGERGLLCISESRLTMTYLFFFFFFFFFIGGFFLLFFFLKTETLGVTIVAQG